MLEKQKQLNPQNMRYVEKKVAEKLIEVQGRWKSRTESEETSTLFGEPEPT